jgi:dynein heavy chain 1
MSAKFKKWESEIHQRKEEAQRDLDEAESALQSAQTSVREIKKRDLDKVRNLSCPPNNVKLTLECVSLMLGEASVEWVDIRKLLAKQDFIPKILNFDADKLSVEQLKLVKEKYLNSNQNFTVERVTRASAACGPLYKWVESQIKYSTIYNNVKALSTEGAQLEVDATLVADEEYKIARCC